MLNPFKRGKRKPPVRQATRSLDLPFMVATDYTLYGSFEDVYPAVTLARSLGKDPANGRVFVLHRGQPFLYIPAGSMA
jgi:hypothetical protein